MNLDEIKALGARLAELCRRYGIAELAVFGSVARGDAGPDSEVDLLYVRVPGNDLGMAYFDLQEDLEGLFGHRADLVAKDGLHRVIRDRVLADAQVLERGDRSGRSVTWRSTSTSGSTGPLSGRSPRKSRPSWRGRC